MVGIFNGGDTHIYAELGSWIVDGRIPYQEIRQVYPPLDVLACAVPHLLPLESYRYAFVWMNYVLYLALLGTWWHRVRAGRIRTNPGSLLILGLPSVLYGATIFNDLWAAGTVMLAFLALADRRFTAAIVLLSCGAFLKSYPALLLAPVFLHIVSQDGPPEQWETDVRRRLWGYLAAFGEAAYWRYILASLGVALLIGSVFTIWTGWSWLTAPLHNYSHENPENLSYLISRLAPLTIHVSDGANIARLVLGGVLAVAFATIPLRSFANTVRISAIVVIASSMMLTWHSPHWNLWFIFLLCLLPVSRILLAVLIVYDLDNLAYWPFFSYLTPIESLRPVAVKYFRVPIMIQCTLKFVLIAMLFCDARRTAAKGEDDALGLPIKRELI